MLTTVLILKGQLYNYLMLHFLSYLHLCNYQIFLQVCRVHRVFPLAHLGPWDPQAPLHLDKVCLFPSVDPLTEETVLLHPSCFLVSLGNLQWGQCLLGLHHQDMGLPQAPLHLSRDHPLQDPSLPVHLAP